jgi:hypothetical protein
MMEPSVIIPRHRWPKVLQAHPEVKGVSVGKCVGNHPATQINHAAQLAHTHDMDPPEPELVGWICFSSRRAMGCRMLVLHELAHVLTPEDPGDGHGELWRRKLKELGGTTKRVDYSRFSMPAFPRRRKR